MERFRRARILSEDGDCEGAVPLLEGLAFPGTLGDEKQLVEVHRMFGVCLFLDGSEDEAVRQFELLLYIDPAYSLDPFRTPPPVVELFDQVKAEIKAKQELIEQAKRDSEDGSEKLAGKTLVIERERVVKEAPFAAVFLPFGLGQWANDEPVKAAVIGGIQAAALIANAAAYWATVSIDLQDGKLGKSPSDEARTAYSIAWGVQAASLGALVASYLYGVGDAWWNYQSHVEVDTKERRRELSPEEAMKVLRPLDQDAE